MKLFIICRFSDIVHTVTLDISVDKCLCVYLSVCCCKCSEIKSKTVRAD